MREYKDHYVAFLDILGFKNILDQYECEEIYSIFDTIHKRSSVSLIWNGINISAYSQIKHKILSDSVILYIEASIEDSFAALLYVCEGLQKSLLLRKKPILLRGGIALGGLFYEEDIIFGEGLTKAYLLESKIAKFPRIVFTEETLEEGKLSTKHMGAMFRPLICRYERDRDGLYFITYCPFLSVRMENWKTYCDVLFSLCNANLRASTDVSIREKYLWLEKQANRTVNMFGNLKAAYAEECKGVYLEQKKEVAEDGSMKNENGNG